MFFQEVCDGVANVIFLLDGRPPTPQQNATAEPNDSTPEQTAAELQVARDHKAGKYDSEESTIVRFPINIVIVELVPPSDGKARQLAVFNGAPLDEKLKHDLHQLGQGVASVLYRRR
jgi:hypothetical protein